MKHLVFIRHTINVNTLPISICNHRKNNASEFFHACILSHYNPCMIATLVNSQVLKCMTSDSRATLFFSIVCYFFLRCCADGGHIPFLYVSPCDGLRSLGEILEASKGD